MARGTDQERRPAVLVGLGNPGHVYSKSRHNAGFQCIRRLAKEGSIRLSRQSAKATVGEGALAGRPVVLAMPQTYVNASGEAVAYLIDRYRLLPEDFLVIYDDMDLPPGRIRLRRRGSAGGHNGMKSIVQALGTLDFGRLRIGVGRPGAGESDVEHVLGKPGPQESEEVDRGVYAAVHAVRCLLQEGYDAAMNRYNTGPQPTPDDERSRRQ